MSEFHLDENDGKDQSKDSPPPQEISSYRKHSMDYFTRDGVILRTGFSNPVHWFLLCIRELLDNSIDFLVRYYQGDDNCVVTVDVFKDDAIFRLKVRNSSYNDYEVFGHRFRSIANSKGLWQTKWILRKLKHERLTAC